MNALSTSAPAFHNFLFMLPATTTKAEQELITNAARQLTALGYVYVASAHERDMEDREDIRFLPLNRDMLPSFGLVTGVFVVRDQAIALAAQEAYPDAQVYVIDPAQSETKTKAVTNPWLTTSTLRTIPLQASAPVAAAA